MAKRKKSIADIVAQVQRITAQQAPASGGSKAAQTQRRVNIRVRQARDIAHTYLQNMGANAFVSADVDKKQSYSTRAGITG